MGLKYIGCGEEEWIKWRAILNMEIKLRVKAGIS
jgi:hypothetical protein